MINSDYFHSPQRGNPFQLAAYKLFDLTTPLLLASIIRFFNQNLGLIRTFIYKPFPPMHIFRPSEAQTHQ